MLDFFYNWDKNILIFFNNLGVEALDDFWLFATKIDSWIALFLYFTLLVFYFYRGKKGWIVFFTALFTVAFTIVFTLFVKETVARLRPNNVPELIGVLRILQQPDSFSFFSGHAASSFSIVTFLVLSIRKYNMYIYGLYLWPLLFACSRIYIGVHYPSDILIGAIVGVVIAILGVQLSVWLQYKWEMKNKPVVLK